MTLDESPNWAHAAAIERGQDPTPPPEAAARLVERFEASLVRTETCWLWQRSLGDNGYGGFFINRTMRVMAHRWSYEHFVGPIPEGLVIDHLCRNRACVNPGHLEPVTPRENLMRGPTTLAAINVAKTHCIHGHEFTPENTAYTKDGYRACRRCRNATARRVQREKTLARKVETLADRRCRVCDAPMPPSMRSNAIHCSLACNNKARKVRLAAARRVSA